MALFDLEEDFSSPMAAIRSDIRRATRPLQYRSRRKPVDESIADTMGEELYNRQKSAPSSGLDYFLDTLDKYTGTRAFRGAITGKPRELLSIIPFSDKLGITDETQKTTSEELTKHLGLPTEGAAGLASNLLVGVLSDPTTYLTFGGKAALTTAGKLAKSVGALDDIGDLAKAAGQSKRAFMRANTIGDLAANDARVARKLARAAKRQGLDWDEMLKSKESLAGAMNIGLPFTSGRVLGKTADVGGLVGLGDKAFGAAEAGVGAAAGKLGSTIANYTPEPVAELAGKATRQTKAAFNTAYGNVTSKVLQPLMPSFVRNLRRADQAVQRRGRQLTQGLEEIGKEAGFEGQQLQDFMSLAAEGQDATKVAQFAGMDPELAQDARELFDMKRSGYDATDAQLDRLGFQRTRDAAEFDLEGNKLADYSPRSASAGKAPPTILDNLYNAVGRTSRPADMSRRDWTKGGYEFEGGVGRYAINKLTQDTDVWDEGRNAYDKIRQGQAILKNYSDDTMTSVGRDLVKQGRAEVKALRVKVGEKYVGLTPERIGELKDTHLALQQQADELRDRIKQAVESGEFNSSLAMDQAALQAAEEGMGWIQHKLALPGLAVRKLGKDLPSQYRGKPLYNDVIGDVMRHEQTSSRKLLTGRFLQEIAANAAVEIQPNSPLMGTDKFRKMKDVLRDSRFTQGSEVTRAAINNVAEKIAKQKGIGVAEAAALIDADRLALPVDVASDMKRMASFMGGDREPGGWRDLYDGVTRMFKAGVTQYWPAFHTRNRVTALAMNWMFDAGDPSRKGVMKYIAPFLDAAKIRNGQVIKGLGGHGIYKGLSDEVATLRLGDLAQQNGLTKGGGAPSELVDQGADALRANESITQDLFGGEGRATRPLLPKGTFDPLNPVQGNLAQRTMGKAGQVATRAHEAALNVGNAVELDNRMAAFIGLTKQGWDPTAAANRVKELHIDYGDLTAFEKSVMRRVMPFYTYTRKMLPLMLDEMIHNPGGKAAQLAKVGSNLKGDAFLPEHIAGGMAIPWGGEDAEGNQSFITGFDMPFELLNDVFQPGHSAQHTAENTFSKVMGMTNPIFKNPIELALGKQFFSGRDLQTLEGNTSRIGRNVKNIGLALSGQEMDNSPVKSNPWVEQTLGMLPISRALSTARTLTDPRKYRDAMTGLPIPTGLLTNLATGARMSDVNIPRAQEMQAREMLTEQLSSVPGVGLLTKPVVKKEAAAKMSDEDLKTYLLYQYILSQSQKRGRERKKQAARGG
jgi:hypothetical protein